MGLIEGVLNMIDKKATIEVVAANRMATCEFCRYYLDGICQKCLCFLMFKTRCKNCKCPVGKW